MKLWKKVTIICVVIAVALFALYFFVYLGDTDFGSSYKSHVQKVMQMEQTDLDSPISGIRTGVFRKVSSLGNNEFECTDDGVYYLAYNVPGIYRLNDDGTKEWSFCNFLFFCPHDSDSMIKLCGRPDCPHDSLDCNAAFFQSDGGITYYNGYLYYIVCTYPDWLPQLWRMKPDGTAKECVLKSADIADDHTYEGYTAPYFQNGIFGVGLAYIDESIQSGRRVDWYYNRLDGKVDSMHETSKGQGWNDGFSFLGGSLQAPDGNFDGNWHLYQWDPKTDTSTHLVQLPEYIQGYWGVDAGYYFQDGKVIKVNYPDGNRSVLFDTGLQGEFVTQFFPDCIAMLENKSRSPENPGMMYFYSWEGERLGEIALGVNNEVGNLLFGGESKDRIMLRGSEICALPEYYIEKSDFGTGHIELHKFKYPDLDEKTYRQLFGED